MKRKLGLNLILFALVLFGSDAIAQEQEATIKLDFVKEDSLKICKAFVSSENAPVKEVEVKLYVQRLFSLLPVGSSDTDEDGIASFEFPNDIPADMNGNLMVVAKIEDDENIANVEQKAEINWGTIRHENMKMERSLSGSRANAPIYFIVVSNLIIAGIWGTLIFVVFQLFKIRKISRHLAKK